MKWNYGLLFLFSCLMISPASEARPGGGSRSFGSGSRGYSPRYSAPSPYRPAPRYANPAAPRPGTPPPAYAPPSSGGGFMRGLAGGVAGGLLGSMLFRGMGYGNSGGYGMGGGGGGGLGLLEILLIAGLGFFIYRWFRNRANGPITQGYTATPMDTPAYEAPTSLSPRDTSADEDPASVLRRYDGAFDLARFQSARVEDFFRVQNAYSHGNLSTIQDKLTPELFWQLEQETSRLREQSRVNRVENIQVAQTDVVEAWQETDREFATLKVRASALDYVLDEKSGELVSGNKEHPTTFEEYWTFARDIGSRATDKQWKLAAIENTAHPA